MSCGLCGVDKENHGTIDFHGIVHVWTDPYEPVTQEQEYDWWSDYLPLIFAIAAIGFFLLLGAGLT